MEFVGAAAVGMIFIGVVFLILVPVAARMRTHGKSKEQQRSEFYADYEKKMEEYKAEEKHRQSRKRKR